MEKTIYIKPEDLPHFLQWASPVLVRSSHAHDVQGVEDPFSFHRQVQELVRELWLGYADVDRSFPDASHTSAAVLLHVLNRSLRTLKQKLECVEVPAPARTAILELSMACLRRMFQAQEEVLRLSIFSNSVLLDSDDAGNKLELEAERTAISRAGCVFTVLRSLQNVATSTLDLDPFVSMKILEATLECFQLLTDRRQSCAVVGAPLSGKTSFIEAVTGVTDADAKTHCATYLPTIYVHRPHFVVPVLTLKPFDKLNQLHSKLKAIWLRTDRSTALRNVFSPPRISTATLASFETEGYVFVRHYSGCDDITQAIRTVNELLSLSDNLFSACCGRGCDDTSGEGVHSFTEEERSAILDLGKLSESAVYPSARILLPFSFESVSIIECEYSSLSENASVNTSATDRMFVPLPRAIVDTPGVGLNAGCSSTSSVIDCAVPQSGSAVFMESSEQLTQRTVPWKCYKWMCLRPSGTHVCLSKWDLVPSAEEFAMLETFSANWRSRFQCNLLDQQLSTCSTACFNAALEVRQLAHSSAALEGPSKLSPVSFEAIKAKVGDHPAVTGGSSQRDTLCELAEKLSKVSGIGYADVMKLFGTDTVEMLKASELVLGTASDFVDRFVAFANGVVDILGGKYMTDLGDDGIDLASAAIGLQNAGNDMLNKDSTSAVSVEDDLSTDEMQKVALAKLQQSFPAFLEKHTFPSLAEARANLTSLVHEVQWVIRREIECFVSRKGRSIGGIHDCHDVMVAQATKILGGLPPVAAGILPEKDDFSEGVVASCCSGWDNAVAQTLKSIPDMSELADEMRMYVCNSSVGAEEWDAIILPDADGSFHFQLPMELITREAQGTISSVSRIFQSMLHVGMSARARNELNLASQFVSVIAAVSAKKDKDVEKGRWAAVVSALSKIRKQMESLSSCSY